MHLPDYYRILGISETASPGEIKAAFRKLTLKYHPDRNPGDKEAIEIFSAIHTAYMVLSDPEKRRDYDLKRPGNHGVIFKDIPVRAVTDRSKIKIMVDKRVVLMGESVRVLISIFENNNKTIVSGLHRFDVVEGPAINSLFPPGPDSPEIEIAYVLKPKEAGYMEIGPASFVSGGTRYLSESVYIKVNPSPDLVKMRPVSRIEKVQSAVVSSLIIFYSFLIGYNVYQFKIFPFMGNFDTPMQPARLSLGDFRLATGDSPYEDYYGRGKFDQSTFNRVVFRNGKSLDAVVLLIDLQSDEIIRNSYIRADEDFTMQHLPDGKYYLKVLFGNDWNDTMRVMKNTGITGGFNRNARFEIFQQEVNIIHLQHSRSGDTLDYKVYEITLYPVQNGNAESISTDSENFFN